MPLPPQERAATRTPQALVAMGHPRGMAVDPRSFGLPEGLGGGRGFVDAGRVSPANRAGTHTPTRQGPTHHHTRTLPPRERDRRWRRRGLRNGPAGLRSRPPTNHHPRGNTTQHPTPTPQPHTRATYTTPAPRSGGSPRQGPGTDTSKSRPATGCWRTTSRTTASTGRTGSAMVHRPGRGLHSGAGGLIRTGSGAGRARRRKLRKPTGLRLLHSGLRHVGHPTTRARPVRTGPVRW